MNTANFSVKSQGSNTNLIKLLVFPIGSLNVALSIDQVQKVINYSTVMGSGLNHYGLVNIGNEEVTVIDLHQKLFKAPQTFNAEDKKYLLLAENSINETFAILIKNSPELYDVQTNIIRTLPESYRRADTLQIASHVFIIDQNEPTEKTVFILDPNELVPPV
jgi:purine-binding chemotaxis protein CheW